MSKASNKFKIVTPESGLKLDSLDLKVGAPLGIFTGVTFLIVKPRESHFTSNLEGNLNPSWTKIRLSYDSIETTYLRVSHEALEFMGIGPTKDKLLGIRSPGIERIYLNPYYMAPIMEFPFKGGYSGLKAILQGLHESSQKSIEGGITVKYDFDLYANWIISELARNKREEQ